METNPSTAAWIVEALGDLYDECVFSDFTVSVDDRKFSCHKFILGACSEYFRGLFRSGMKESKESSVHLPDIRGETFQSILDVLYKGRKVLNRKNIVDIWQVSHHLQIDGLLAECEEFVLENMDMTNYEEFYSKARLLSSEKVKRFAVANFFAKKYEHVMTTDMFLDLSHVELLQVIQNEHLSVFSEDVVVKSILRWLGNPKNSPSTPKTTVNNKSKKNSSRFARDRVKHLSNFLAVTKLALVSDECLTSLQNDVLYLCDTDVQAVINKALFAKFYSCSQRCILSMAAQRPCSSLVDGVLFLHETQQQRFTSFSFFNLRTRQFTTCSKLPRFPPLFSTGVDSLLVSASCCSTYRSSDCDFYFKTLEDLRMLRLPGQEILTLSLRASRKCAVILHKSYLYVFADDASITRFDISRQCWDQYTAMDDVATFQSTRLYSYALSRDKILLFRETHVNNRVVVTCFDTATRQTMTVQDFEGSARRVSFFNTFEDTFILQEDGALWKLVRSGSALKLERITKLFCGSDWLVRGCMHYNGTTFVFRKRKNSKTEALMEKDVFAASNSFHFRFVSMTTEVYNIPIILSKTALETFQ